MLPVFSPHWLDAPCPPDDVYDHKMIFSQVRQRRRRRGGEERLTLVLIAIVTTFLICSLPRLVLFIRTLTFTILYLRPSLNLTDQDDPQPARDVHPGLDPQVSPIFPWRISCLEHCPWICLPCSSGTFCPFFLSGFLCLSSFFSTIQNAHRWWTPLQTCSSTAPSEPGIWQPSVMH